MKVKVYTIDCEENGKKFVQSVKVEFSRSKQFGYDAKKLEALEEMAEALILEGLKLAELEGGQP